MDLSLLLLTLSVMCFPVCQPKALTNHKDFMHKHNDGINEHRKYPKAEDFNKRMTNSAARKIPIKHFIHMVWIL